MTEDIGRSPDGSGSRPSDGAASTGVSPPDGASIPNAEIHEPWRAFMELRAWNDGRRPEVLMLVQKGMALWRDSVATAQQRYEQDCAMLADYMAAFVHLSSVIASDAAAAFGDASGIEARSDETRSGSAEGESPVAKPDAQGPVS